MGKKIKDASDTRWWTRIAGRSSRTPQLRSRTVMAPSRCCGRRVRVAVRATGLCRCGPPTKDRLWWSPTVFGLCVRQITSAHWALLQRRRWPDDRWGVVECGRSPSEEFPGSAAKCSSMASRIRGGALRATATNRAASSLLFRTTCPKHRIRSQLGDSALNARHCFLTATPTTESALRAMVINRPASTSSFRTMCRRPPTPSISLQEYPDAGAVFIEVEGIGFTPNQAVQVAYDISSGSGPIERQIGDVLVASDGGGGFVHVIQSNVFDINGAQAQATDLASGKKASAST